MKVNEQNEIIKAMSEHWGVIHALLSGTPGMRAAKTKLLPKWPNEEQVSYDNRVGTATLFPAFERTLNVMAGKPFSQQVVLGDDVPPVIVEYCQDVNLEGQNLHAFSFEVFREAMAYGLCGVLVDCPVVQETTKPRTVADEKAMGVRPYFTFIKHDQILGWKAVKVQGVLTLTMLRIMESVEEDDGEFGTVCIPQVRVLQPGIWQTYRKSDAAKDEWVEYEFGINTISVIPFVPFYGKRLGFLKASSALENLAYLNVKHWQSQSDQDTILHVARVPILAISGAEQADDKGNGGTVLTLGSSMGIKLPLNAKMEYVEHKGMSIKAGAESLKDLEDQMVQCGAELLVKKPGDRSATEAAGDQEGNKSDLQRMAEGFEDSMDQALQYMALWINQPQGGHCSVFKDFGAFDLSDASAQVVLAMQAAGLITRETALKEQQRRGILSPDLNPAVELELVEEEGVEMAQSLLAAQAALGIDPLTGLPITKEPGTEQE